MAEFKTADLTTQAPEHKAICPECARHGVEHLPTETLLAYCIHNLTGAYRATGRDWKTIPGIEPGIFREVFLRGLIGSELRMELQRDLTALHIGLQRDLTALIQDEANHSTLH